jgi:hypothetical protein
MSPSVELSPQTFARLQAHAIPLVDNIESVINRLADFYETKGGAPIPAAVNGGGDVISARQFNPVAPPDLTHTKVLTIEFNGKPLEHGKVNWGGLLIAAVREAKRKAKSPSDLKRLITVNYVERQKEDEGYKFISDIGLSVQGQDANSAWRAACHIAQQLGCQLLVTFVWREKEDAAFPGVTGQFSIPAR